MKMSEYEELKNIIIKMKKNSINMFVLNPYVYGQWHHSDNYKSKDRKKVDEIVIEALEKAQKYGDDIQRKDDYIKQLEHKNMELQGKAIRQNEWISVDDKLPEQEQHVEICKIVRQQAIYDPENNQFYSWKLCGLDEPFRRYNKCVSHWKAL